MSNCPSADDVASFLEGGSAESVTKEVLEHLDVCTPCRMLIANSLQTASVGTSRDATGVAILQTFRENETVDGRYRIVRFISRGGMGEVYEAWDTQLLETVALKTIVCTGLDNSRLFAQLRAEVQIARKVSHPNVCRMLEFGLHPRESRGTTERIPFFTMELLSGETLGHFNAQWGPLPDSKLLPIVLQIVDGLSAVHQAGIVHRDLKPDNVFLLREESGRERAVVMDFGLARSLTKPSTFVSSNGTAGVGTPAYMAPEQATGGKPSTSWDIYAFGVMLFELLSGKLPFRGESAVAVALIRSQEPAPRVSSIVPSVNPRMERIVARCLEREPQRRFSNTLELRAALSEALSGRDPQRGWSFASPARNALTMVLFGTTLGLGIAGLLRVHQSNHQRGEPTALRERRVESSIHVKQTARASGGVGNGSSISQTPHAPQLAAAPVRIAATVTPNRTSQRRGSEKLRTASTPEPSGIAAATAISKDATVAAPLQTINDDDLAIPNFAVRRSQVSAAHRE